MLNIILLLAIVAFVIYALVTQYQTTDTTQGVPARVWASFVAAGTALGALAMSVFKSGVAP